MKVEHWLETVKINSRVIDPVIFRYVNLAQGWVGISVEQGIRTDDMEPEALKRLAYRLSRLADLAIARREKRSVPR